ncbi:hypothetical protein [Stenotrophomonas sp.]|uniref:hypothetical protein n=1 Tax=Stenotrophomonas sp. TaxID=69392 RepID=UPI0028AE03A0|nr:hypothetical protein [Stenotrophomonas sp.]
MSTHPMPACEALAADPARYMFKQQLAELVEARDYDEKFRMVCRLGGYLSALLEGDVITCEEHKALREEMHEFVWGAAQ